MKWSALFVSLALCLECSSALCEEEKGIGRPNIVIIMADDMGFSDLGCYGGEIPTPNLDQLAESGLRFTQFYNTGRCCPTRAALLTGLYPHQAGVGHMTEDKGALMPGYRGRLTSRCVTIAEVLKEAGYFTAAAGKWHVGSERSSLPLQRGFDRFFGVPQGGGFYFKARPGRDVLEGNRVVYNADRQPPEGWYSTDAWNEAAVRYVQTARELGKPFFLYLAHNAPHFPLQVPQAEIGKHLERYAKGWDPIRDARWAKQQKLGLTTEAWRLSRRDLPARSWATLPAPEKARQQKAMAIYAAMVEHLDKTIADLIAALKKERAYENTVILFLSDNGGCAEGGVLAEDSEMSAIEDWGSERSFIRCGRLWANVQNTPFREYKHFTHEGGIASPLIVHWPAGLPQSRRGKFCRTPAHVIDLMATCIDLALTDYPRMHAGRELLPLEGESLVPLLEGSEEPLHPALYWEHEGNRAIRVGDWKLVARHNQPWELYDLRVDRSERSNVATLHPQRVQTLANQWETWARNSYVLPWSRVTGR